MSEILQALGSSAWWFSTIFVAIIANVIANYIYDALKAKVRGRWISVSVLLLYIIWYGLFIASIFTLPIRNEIAVQLVLACVVSAFLGLYETYRLPGMGFAMTITVASVFSLTFFEPEFPRALADRDMIWFGQQYFYCTIMSILVRVFIAGLFYKRHIRKRRGLAK